MRTQLVHRVSAVLLIIFILTHLAIHLTAIAGPEVHKSAMAIAQIAYRNPVGETILVTAVMIQIFTGIKQLRWRGQKGWALAQIISGAYLFLFLIVHTSAALYTHHIFGIESDFYWAAGTLNYHPIRLFFGPYYFAAILAFFTHLSAALHFAKPGGIGAVALPLPCLGILIAGTIIMTFSGFFYEIEIPSETAAYFEKTFGVMKVSN